MTQINIRVISLNLVSSAARRHSPDGDAPGAQVRQRTALRDVRVGVRDAAAQDAEALELGVLRA